MNNFNMFLLLITLSSALQAKLDLNRPEAKPNTHLSKTDSFIRELFDFCGIENLGFHALLPANETYIRNIIHDLNMDDYCIEIRAMSNELQRVVGRSNAMAMPSAIFNKKSHAYIFISEDWFEALPDQEKQALVRHELMHLKNNHGRRRLLFGLGSYLTLMGLEAAINCSRKSDNFFTLPTTASRLIAWVLLTSSYSRMMEKEADIDAAKTMTDKQGMLDLFKTLKEDTEDPESKFAVKRFVNNLLEPIEDLLRSHPRIDERVGYITYLNLI